MIGRKVSSTGVPRGTEGGIGAFTLLVGLIVLLVLAAAYSVNNSDSDTASGNDRLVAAQGAGTRPGSPQARQRNAALVRARRAVRRAAARRNAAQRAAARANRRRGTVTVTVTRSLPARGASVQYLCAHESRGGSRAAKRARRQRVQARRQTLRYLNLHC